MTLQLTLRPEQTVLPLVDKSNTEETRRGVSFQHPEILAHADLVTSTLSEPYYWRLPEQFTGSMVGENFSANEYLYKCCEVAAKVWFSSHFLHWSSDHGIWRAAEIRRVL